MKNIFILYNSETGDIAFHPCTIEGDEWTNIPTGCGLLGPIGVEEVSEAVLAATKRPELYRVVRGEVIEKDGAEAMLLSEAKGLKISELNTRCEETILAGFASSTTGHLYSFSQYDQMNFTQQCLQLHRKPEESIVVWKTEDAGPMVHSREQFLQVCDEAEAHKMGNIQRYWEMKAQIEAAATVEEVGAIQW